MSFDSLAHVSVDARFSSCLVDCDADSGRNCSVENTVSSSRELVLGCSDMARFGVSRFYQQTLPHDLVFSGVGVHSGRQAILTVRPAPQNVGVVFRVMMEDGCVLSLPASYRFVSSVELCTVLGVSDASVGTVEHLLSALYAFGVDNCYVDIDGSEVPILDGSAREFTDRLAAVELVPYCEAPLAYIKILKPIVIEDGDKRCALFPHNNGFRFDVDIAFDHELIGSQSFSYTLSADTYGQEIAFARTFGFMKDVERLRAAGLGLGAGLENAIVLGDRDVLNPEGLRVPDEFVRHKVLDAIGDLSLIGAPVIGRYVSYKAGHKMNVAMARALHDTPESWTYVRFTDDQVDPFLLQQHLSGAFTVRGRA